MIFPYFDFKSFNSRIYPSIASNNPSLIYRYSIFTVSYITHVYLHL
nr:MAG TPA: hypothetical protein [Caudoviricetes sp.]